MTIAGQVGFNHAEVLIRTYTHAHVWCWEPGQSLADALASEACRVPAALEPQGETVAFRPDSSAYYTLSELANQPLHRYDRSG